MKTSEEFWIIGIVKKRPKRIKDNLWVLVIDEKDASHRFKRLSEVTDISWIANRYDSFHKARLMIEAFLRNKFRNLYEFKILHYVKGKFLDVTECLD